MAEVIEIWTDGACSGNPGPGGWAAVISRDGEIERLSGHEAHTTNKRMELTAAIKGLEALAAGTVVTVHSDSMLLVSTMKDQWKRKKNLDLWDQLDDLAEQLEVSWVWVRGHSDSEYNRVADRMASRALERGRR